LSPVDGRPDRYARRPEHLHPERDTHDPVIVSVAERRIVKRQNPFEISQERLKSNYYGNLMSLTSVPTMTLTWPIKHSFSVRTRRRLAP
jgi:hypothetical protein